MLTFKTEVLGVEMEIEGEFFGQAFDIHSITHKGDELDMAGINEAVLDHIGAEAVKQATKAAMGEEL